MIEVEVTLKFMRYVKLNYNVGSYLSHLLRQLQVARNKIEVGPCIHFRSNGIRVYYTSNARTVIAVESRNALILYQLDKLGEWDFIYKGPPIVTLTGDMLYCITILLNYATMLEVVKNESSFPEIHWSESKPYDFEKVVRRSYDVVNSRYEEIFKLITRKYKPISQYMRYELDKEASTNHRTVIDLLYRALVCKAEWDIQNASEVIETLLTYPLKHIPRVCESLSSRKAAQQTLTVYGAILY